MTIQHKLVAIKPMVVAVLAELEYYKEKCRRQQEVLDNISVILIQAESTSEEILGTLEAATVSSQLFSNGDEKDYSEVGRDLKQYIDTLKNKEHVDAQD